VRDATATVFVVDDDVGVRLALDSLIASVGLRAVCFASAEEFIVQRQTDRPACLVLDVRMPGLSGLDLQRELAGTPNRIPIIFITAHADVPMAVAAMKGGAVEFLSKPFRDRDLLDAIGHALELDRAAKRHSAALDGVQNRAAHLTERQRQIITRMLDGRLNKQIAAELELSENTVKAHRRRIMKQMGAANFAELVRMIELLNSKCELHPRNQPAPGAFMTLTR
jgi:FixJ family two-component response regulator